MMKEYDLSLEEKGYGTDLDAALRFAEQTHHSLRYAPGIGWLWWDGMRWAVDKSGRAIEEGKRCARKWTRSFVNSDIEGREARVRQALSLESATHIRSAVELAKSDPRIVIAADRLDADPWLLNMMNGTLDLRTGQLVKNKRTHFITKLAPVEYDPQATHPAFKRYLDGLEKDSPGMGGFLSRCLGASLTGDASPESLFLLQGQGGSGKTTLSEAFAAMMGDYAVKLPFEVFCVSRHGRAPGSASPDLIKLRGARFAYASEGDQSAKLDAGVVKSLTGGEPFTARALYSDPITFQQTFKLWMVSNFDPRADSDDSGLWRRIVKVPFAAIPENLRDITIKEVLCTDALARAAVLAWTVRGCLEWQASGRGRKGLNIPAEVSTATDAYRQKQDTLGQWFDSLIADGARIEQWGKTAVSAVRRHYEEWCDEEGASPCMSKRFNEFLTSKGLTRTRGTGGVKQWQGLDIPGE